MSWFLAAATTAWLAAAVVMVAFLLPVAAVARLLPVRLSRIAALLWAGIAAAGIAAAVGAAISLPAWATHRLEYTPHLERPLPHFCFAEMARGLGEGTVRVASLIALVLWLLGLVRLVSSALRGASVARSLASAAAPLSNPFSSRVLSVRSEASWAALAPLAQTAGFFHPVVAVPEATVSDMQPEAAAAVLLHELDHAFWRDPAVALVLSGLAWTFPGLGWVVYRQWRLHSERAADVAAARRAGQAALVQAAALLAGRDAGDRHGLLAASGGLDRPGPALAAAFGWLLLVVAAWPALYPLALMTLVCVFETTASAWR